MIVPIEESLLPCPFCGEPVEFVFNDELDDGSGSIECHHCAVVMTVDYWDQAVSKWNRRADRRQERRENEL